MKKNYYGVCLFIIILLGFFVRFYKLGQAPAGLYLDEAGQGYSAYSILKTGKDEFGMPFPAAFRSFNDFKTPVYVYLIAPLIPIFGLNAFSIRFPSFFFSILTLPLLYFLIKKLDPSKYKSTIYDLPLISVLFLAISPWHVLFGRTNFECNVALFFLLFGIFLFQLALKKPIFLIVSAFFFAIALPAYHSERILVPLVLMYLLVKYYKTLLSPEYLKYSILSLVLGVIITLPTIMIINTPGFLARVSTLSIFGSEHSWGVKEWPSLYLSYFSPRQLFWLGDAGPRSSFPGLSVFYLWQLPLFMHGLYLFFTKKISPNLKQFIILMLVISPIPASLTRDPFSTIRALPLVIPLTIICALSATEILKKMSLKFKILVVFIFTIYSLLKLYSSGYLLNEYYRASSWDYGWEQVSEVIKKELNPNLPIIVDNARNEPYSQLLVFLKPDPAEYQKDNFEVSNQDYYTYMGRNTTKKIGNLTTRGINWTEDKKIEQYLIGDSLAISYEQIKDNNLTLIKEIKYPDGSPIFIITKTNPK